MACFDRHSHLSNKSWTRDAMRYDCIGQKKTTANFPIASLINGYIIDCPIVRSIDTNVCIGNNKQAQTMEEWVQMEECTRQRYGKFSCLLSCWFLKHFFCPAFSHIRSFGCYFICDKTRQQFFSQNLEVCLDYRDNFVAITMHTNVAINIQSSLSFMMLNKVLLC